MIRYQVMEDVATITIDDPTRRNPLSNAEMESLETAIRRSATDEAVRVVVITGAGDKAFSAGGDLKSGFVDGPLPGHQQRGALADVFRAMHKNPKPIVGRINGVAFGGGFGVAAACDIVIATEDSKFGTPEIDLGLWPMMISAVLLPMVSRRTLLEMMMTGRIISASDAKQIGIVSSVVPADTLDESVAETVATLLSKSSAALALGKESFYAIAGMDMDSALDHLHIGLTATALTEDAVEGVSAFIDGREATWKGR